MPNPPKINISALETNLMLDGVPYLVHQAIVTIVQHIARGGKLGGVARSALFYALQVSHEARPDVVEEAN